MTVRLGFAVAAHLEPEILVVDEVLAVGDAEFQKKAIGKMQDLSSGEGRTVFFVSHNMASIRNLCSWALLIKNGTLDFQGEVDEVINKYLELSVEKNNVCLLHDAERKGNGSVTLDKIIIYREMENQFPRSGEPLTFDFYLNNPDKFYSNDIELQFRIDDNLGQRLIWNSSKANIIKEDLIPRVIRVKMDRCILNNGIYYGTVYLKVKNRESDWMQNGFSFEVEQGLYYKSGLEVPTSQSKILADFNYKFYD